MTTAELLAEVFREKQSCTRKRAYRTQELAIETGKDRMENYGADQLYFYRCEFCSFFHLTKQSSVRSGKPATFIERSVAPLTHRISMRQAG